MVFAWCGAGGKGLHKPNKEFTLDTPPSKQGSHCHLSHVPCHTSTSHRHTRVFCFGSERQQQGIGTALRADRCRLGDTWTALPSFFTSGSTPPPAPRLFQSQSQQSKMAAPDKLIGSHICLIPKKDVRYEGILFSIEKEAKPHVILQAVKCHGTVPRPMTPSTTSSCLKPMISRIRRSTTRRPLPRLLLPPPRWRPLSRSSRNSSRSSKEGHSPLRHCCRRRPRRICPMILMCMT